MHRAFFIDFNSYFASAEQHRRPEWRQIPVAVVPSMTLTTCCLAASRQARKFGIKTGTKVAEALKMCPRLQLVEADPAYYMELHEQLKEVIDARLPIGEVRPGNTGRPPWRWLWRISSRRTWYAGWARC
jgi:DNA polymerase-4